MRLKEIENIDSHIRWDAGIMTNSDWPVQFLVTMQYTDYYDAEWAKQGKYHISIDAVAPEAVGDKEIASACESMSTTREDFDRIRFGNDAILFQSVLLSEYGIKATLWQQQGNNQTVLLKAARKELAVIRTLFGFYMDKPQNRIGSTGWDFIKGDALAGLHRHSNRPENATMKKIAGD